MKKIFLISGMVLCMTCPAFATDPTGIPATNGAAYNNPPEDCIVSVLGVDEGSASLQADWQANVINLTWNANGGTASDGTAYSPGNASTTCTYDGSITLPPTPTRVGYTFAGWDVTSVTSNT